MDRHEQGPGLDFDQAACHLGVNCKQLETMILPTFLREYEGILQRVREAQETSDYRALEAWGHRAKGAYFYLGADGLQAEAEALETRIREEKTAPVEEIEGFAEALQTTLDAIRRLL